LDGIEAGPKPAAFRATTVNVYVIPLVRPKIVAVSPVVVTVPTAPSGSDVTV
jgi:hypothetical protein